MHSQSHNKLLILASTSRYRKSLLERLGLPFQTWSPDVDETALEKEPAPDLVERLARLKAASAQDRFPDAVVIGSDQVAECDGEIVGKPGTADRAQAQLASFSGRTVRFLTAVHVRCGASAIEHDAVVETAAVFRKLSGEEIERYIEQDQPLDCAGSFKSEQAGIGLLDALESPDPTAIIGLPLITVSRALRDLGFHIP